MALHEFLRLSDKVAVLPVVHGNGDFAVEVRRVMLAEDFDCLAVPLPHSFQQAVEDGVRDLPRLSFAIQPDRAKFDFFRLPEWSPERDAGEEDDDEQDFEASFVSIEPCQPVVSGIRVALGEHIPRAFIDLEVDRFRGRTAALPDPYALKKVSPAAFAAAVLPSIPRPDDRLTKNRVRWMARRLRDLESRHERILFLCSIMDWPWIKEAYDANTPLEDAETGEPLLPEETQPVELHPADPQTLIFHLGELPFITGLYEKARAELDPDENLSIDGVKELLLAARDEYRKELKNRARPLTPKLLATIMHYVRNLSLVERRLTPDFYSIVVAAQQVGGNMFARYVAEVARKYPYGRPEDERDPDAPPAGVRIGPEWLETPGGLVARHSDRLPGLRFEWRSVDLTPLPPKPKVEECQQQWDPYTTCSWPPEDEAIENFRNRVMDAAREIMGGDLARSEKFSTSLKDGLDIRETLRNWHTGDLYVKVNPPAVGDLDAVVMIFESPADPREYPWRITWSAEHHNESTLATFATDYREEMIGPKIALARAGGCLFLYPPRPIRDIWTDRRLDFCDTLEERLVAGACMHAEHKHVAFLAPAPPGLGWRRIAKHYKKTLVHVPLGRFNAPLVERLRMFHVLNGHDVRSYAAQFIRR